MEIDKEKLNKFLTESTSYFKEQRWPECMPAFIKQIPDAIREFKNSIEKSTLASNNLTTSVRNLTYAGVIISAIALILEIYKIFII